MKSLEEFECWFEKVKKNEDEQLKFVWEIMKSPYVEYHYSLMTDINIDENFRNDLWSRFDEHREKGAELLLSKLDKNEDKDFHPDIIFCIGKLADRYNTERGKTLEYARKFASADENYLRSRAIIVLGWIGEMKDLTLLGEHLLNDTDAKCRTWSATSFMQMYFRQKNKSLVDKALHYLHQSISKETDYFALGCMIDVVKELTGKNFGLPRYAIDNADKEKIDNAKLKVERFFNKLYNK